VSDRVAAWWRSGVPPSVKFVYLVLLANGLPAFLILTFAPAHTADLFVWTIKPDASAQLLGVMYGNALLLVAIGLLQPDWARARITVVLIAFFSVAATIVTLFNLHPFLRHPWYHLTYWLTMYVILFFAAPFVLVREERRHGGRLPVDVPLKGAARIVGACCAVVLGVTGVAVLVDTSSVSDLWPWPLTPLVGRILGVWLCSLALAYVWALWDGDRIRTRPIFIQGIITGPALALVPLIHRADVRSDPAGELALYLGLAALVALSGLVEVLDRRSNRAVLETATPGAR
jgi:hypothetical protein